MIWPEAIATLSWYSVAVWLNVPDEEVMPGLRVRTAWCHLPLLTVAKTLPFPKPSTHSPGRGIVSPSLMPTTCASRQPLLSIHRAGGLPPLCGVLADSSVPLPVVLNHSSTDSAPVPVKYPPGTLT